MSYVDGAAKTRADASGFRGSQGSAAVGDESHPSAGFREPAQATIERGLPTGTAQAGTEPGQVFVDALTFGAAVHLLRMKSRPRVSLLDAMRGVQRIWAWVLKLRGMTVSEAGFHAGDTGGDEGRTPYLSSYAVSGAIALEAAKAMVQSVPELRRLNSEYGRETVRLIVAKAVRPHIRHWTSRILVAQAQGAGERVRILLKGPDWFDGEALRRWFANVDLEFYSTPRVPPLESFAPRLVAVLREWKGRLASPRQHPFPSAAQRKTPAVLMLQEDNVRVDRSLRGQPHWLDAAHPAEAYEVYVLQLGSLFVAAEPADDREKAGISLLSRDCLRPALSAARDHVAIRRVRGDRSRTLDAARRGKNMAERLVLIRVAAALREAEMIGSLALWVNARTFLVRETYYSFADAMQLVAGDLNVRTIAYQYSNLGVAGPGLLSTADLLVGFSEMYRDVYDVDGIAPREFMTAGYVYDGIARIVGSKAQEHRALLRRAGAEFVLCFFDESVQHDHWGLVDTRAHLAELHVLAEMVLGDPTIGVVVKSQFMRNSPSQLYPGDQLIQRAKASGRYLELMEGAHRNDVFPTEAALAADLCIGHKFGATAALEAAVAGVRTVLLDRYNTRTLWDRVYALADIEYASMEVLAAAITAHRAGAIQKQALGDWTPIIHHFDPYRDGRAVERLRATVEQSTLGYSVSSESVPDKGTLS